MFAKALPDKIMLDDSEWELHMERRVRPAISRASLKRLRDCLGDWCTAWERNGGIDKVYRALTSREIRDRRNSVR